MIPLAFLSWLRSAFGAVVGVVTRYPCQCALAASLVLNGWLYHARAGCLDRLADVKPAQARATAAQVAVNHQPAAISAAIGEQSNAQAPAYYRSVGDAADLHRVRAVCANSATAADLPGTDHPASLDDRPADPAGMVSRPRADDDLLVAAAARAAQMHADAQALIAAGVAVPTSSIDQTKEN